MPASTLTASPILARARGVRARAPVPALAAAATLIVAWLVLLAIHPSPRLVVSRSQALRYALTDPASRPVLDKVRWDRLGITPLDHDEELLGFYRGPRLLVNVTVQRVRGQHAVISEVSDLSHQAYAFGSPIANDLRVLGGLTLLFVLMSAVWPLWRLRNLDVLAAASLVLSVILFNRWLLGRQVAISYAALAYLALRSVWWATRRAPAEKPSAALFDRVTELWAPVQRLRCLRLIAAATGLVVAVVGLSSPHVLDVGYAAMEGATSILHGVLPYGHVRDVFHGDTYPLASYLLYVPAAWIAPVKTQWDSADATLIVAVGAALLAAWGMSRLMGRAGASSVQARCTRLRSAIAWMTFPPLLVAVSTGTTDVVLAALVVWALVLWRRPTASSGVLAIGAWFKLSPVALMPLWLARLRGPALGRALGAISFVSAAMLAVLFALGGTDGPVRMVHALTFQFTRGSPHTLWGQIGSMPVQQLAQAATLALIVGSTLALRRDRSLAADLPRVAALSAAVLIGLQLSASYWNYMYLVWIAPLLAVSILGAGGQLEVGAQESVEISGSRTQLSAGTSR